MPNSQNLAFFTAIKTAIKNHKIFTLFIVLYGAVLVTFSRYAPNLDDTWLWLRIIEGEIDEIYMGFRPQIGRFWILGLVELPILAKISTSPYLFFAFNALLFTLFSTLYLKILNISLGKSALNALITALLALSAAFVMVFFGICYGEKIQIIWIAIFMLCSFFVIQKPTNINQLLGIIALNTALYYKEPTFIATFAFGVILLIFAIQNRHKDLAKYALCVIFSACYFALLYYYLIFGEIDKTYSSLVAKSTLAVLWEYAINDSIVVFCVCGAMLFRAYLVIFRKAQIEPFFDGFLCASFTYFAVFMVLKMSAPYYLLPCYVFGIPSLLYFGRKYFCNLFIKIVLFLGLFGFLAQNLPSGIHKMIDLKAQGVQFHKTLDFVAQYLRENKGTDIYFEGIGRGRELYDFETEMRPFWFAEYLKKIYSVYDFDLRTSAPNGIDFNIDESSSFPIFNSDKIDTPKTNDLIIVSNKSAFGDSLIVAQNCGDLLYQSGFPTIPKIALMPLIKYLNARYFKSKIFGKNNNFFALPRETYVFRAN